MMDKNLHKLKRIFQKIGIYFTKRLNFIKKGLNDNELEASIIFRKLLSNPKTELLTSPLSGKYYLKSVKKDMLVILSSNQLSIINHIYSYNVYVPDFLYQKLRSVFIQEVEKRRFEMEEEFRKNVQHSLKNIISSLKNEK